MRDKLKPETRAQLRELLTEDEQAAFDQGALSELEAVGRVLVQLVGGSARREPAPGDESAGEPRALPVLAELADVIAKLPDAEVRAMQAVDGRVGAAPIYAARLGE